MTGMKAVCLTAEEGQALADALEEGPPIDQECVVDPDLVKDILKQGGAIYVLTAEPSPPPPPPQPDPP